MDLMVVNPIEEPREGLEEAMQIVSEFVGYLFAQSRHFPDRSVEEIWSAVKRIRRYNREREAGEPLCLWPSRECIEAALYHFDLHEVPESFPPVKLKRNERGELYLDFQDMATKSTKKIKRLNGKMKFDRMFKARIKKEQGRADAVQWLAEKSRFSYNVVSRVLNHRMPRRNSAGREYASWLNIKKHLTGEEIEILEKVPYQG